MNKNFDKFIEWTKTEGIELLPIQKEVIKIFFEGGNVKIPRRNDRNYGFELVARYYQR